MTEKEKEVLRMAGHLLEYHPTTEVGAKDREGCEINPLTGGAACWCLIGATSAVGSVLKLTRSPIALLVDFFNTYNIIDVWEGPDTSSETRLAIAKKLQEVR